MRKVNTGIKKQLRVEYAELKANYVEAHKRIEELISGVRELPEEEKIEELILIYPELDTIDEYMDTIWNQILKIRVKLSQ